MSTKVGLQPKATIADLYRVPENGKAEIIDGRLVRFMSTGKRPNRVSGNIYLSLRQHEKQSTGGLAVADNGGFIVHLPNRESFSPDAAWYLGEIGNADNEMDFYEGAPVFAAEVRSKNDYGEAAERALEAKRRDYFAAGTLVVWDVDARSEAVVRAYRSDKPEHPLIFRRGEVADAEPAVPGWRMPVDELFQ